MSKSITYNSVNITHREIEIIFDSTSEYGSKKKLSRIRKHFKKEKQHLLTLKELSIYTDVPIEELKERLNPNKK